MSDMFDLFAFGDEKKTETKKAAEKKEVTSAVKKEEPIKEEIKKEKKTSSKKAESKESNDIYEYPFSLYTEGRTVDISEYGFEDKKKYTSKEICDIMLRHRHYEFAGEMAFKLFEDDNTLVATAKQYKKG